LCQKTDTLWDFIVGIHSGSAKQKNPKRLAKSLECLGDAQMLTLIGWRGVPVQKLGAQAGGERRPFTRNLLSTGLLNRRSSSHPDSTIDRHA
jgi:hypothetical protein